MAELSKLLGFMSSWDRQAVLDKYNALFDEAGDEVSLIKMLGSPTHLAISLANSYVPTPAPVVPAVEKEPVDPFAEFTSEPEPAQPAPELIPEKVQIEEAPAPPAKAGKKVRPFGLIVSIIFGLLIGLPIAVVLICVGIPFLVLGLSLVGAAVAAVLELIGLLAMVSDILVVVGAGLVIAAIGLFIAWFGLWLSLALGQLWIGGAVLKACRAMSFKKEVAA